MSSFILSLLIRAHYIHLVPCDHAWWSSEYQFIKLTADWLRTTSTLHLWLSLKYRRKPEFGWFGYPQFTYTPSVFYHLRSVSSLSHLFSTFSVLHCSMCRVCILPIPSTLLRVSPFCSPPTSVWTPNSTPWPLLVLSSFASPASTANEPRAPAKSNPTYSS